MREKGGRGEKEEQGNGGRETGTIRKREERVKRVGECDSEKCESYHVSSNMNLHTSYTYMHRYIP